MAIAQIPPGLRDILPQEASELRQIESSLAATFGSFGYEEVAAPTFEYFDLLAVETGEVIRREMLKFFDQDGRILALRPELTTPIARLCAQRLRGADLPLRLSYSQTVFRQEPPQRGQQREFRQAGVELIGEPGPSADAEIVVMMVESLRRAGLADFQVGVGQAGFVVGLIEEVTTGEETKERIRTALLSKDYVGLSEATDNLGATGEALRSLLSLRGGDVFSRAANIVKNQKSLEALENLSSIYDFVRDAGVSKHVVPDLGIIRDFDYYTGAIFEGYAGGMGFPVSGGGRYDTLTAAFGWEQPATGFQHGVERLHIALSLQGSLPAYENLDEVLFTFSGTASGLFAGASLLRGAGVDVRAIFAPLESEDKAVSLAKAKGRCVVMAIDADNFVVAPRGGVAKQAATGASLVEAVKDALKGAAREA